MMLSYQHAYHAGNAADVHKHTILAQLLARLTEKAKPLTYMETHAGRGIYDLSNTEAEKTGEARNGIVRLLERNGLADGHPYLRAIEITRRGFGPTSYPGSPMIARTLLRPDDQIHLMELHPQEHAALKRVLRAPNVHIHRRDGYEGVLAIAPPTPRRGMVLIDPSYEIKDEYEDVAAFLPRLHRKWAEAVIMLWYPILPACRHETMAATIERAGLKGFLRHEIRFAETTSERGIQGSGLIFANLPHGFDSVTRAYAWP
ncbi:MAG: 23S rRNA (adenine(2030)-N(6))-methyltransferase RlmJ [Rhodospirillales bacterium]|nr:23S rRNA (adenine(2030)-N(6))-methyltransferase RlmJ [Rhodospirillales bacterium]MCW8863002.1 23S rRNA (adenine(2030)-N(6))-methyltransferase RlmJ [Rhodospirillales bacterium]MCW8953187.1 23S rRNA (adenine(2030)-N(6))-methyltransferase RlmJ [Rhodospirillales bacterium]MCW8970514.1 23S rRNA (adenine(2030)-N(6))-methyltransferase RlmJ [Rhodospirillales bacterium]MCW9002504.1 23S rRNA (adenine(2030)-N(6))-methyltransferase RlmJ [Rhodospirillales bacterium]